MAYTLNEYVSTFCGKVGSIFSGIPGLGCFATLTRDSLPQWTNVPDFKDIPNYPIYGKLPIHTNSRDDFTDRLNRYILLDQLRINEDILRVFTFIDNHLHQIIQRTPCFIKIDEEFNPTPKKKQFHCAYVSIIMACFLFVSKRDISKILSNPEIDEYIDMANPLSQKLIDDNINRLPFSPVIELNDGINIIALYSRNCQQRRHVCMVFKFDNQCIILDSFAYGENGLRYPWLHIMMYGEFQDIVSFINTNQDIILQEKILKVYFSIPDILSQNYARGFRELDTYTERLKSVGHGMSNCTLPENPLCYASVIYTESDLVDNNLKSVTSSSSRLKPSKSGKLYKPNNRESHKIAPYPKKTPKGGKTKKRKI
jgi:hypothetical protein